MGKFVRKFGLTMAVGAAVAHYLSTEKGQHLLTKVKKGLEAYQANPDHYQEQARTFFKEQVVTVKDLVQELTSEDTETAGPTSAIVDDIIITYPEED